MREFDVQIGAFSAEIEEELKSGNLSFPTVFDLSLRIKQMADDPNASTEDMAKLVRAEPVLSAKVLKMANSLLLNPYQREISNVSTAVSRIGSSALRCLAYAVAADQLARDQRSRQMQLVASGLWMHSIDVASWAYAFARHLGRGNPDTALLAGLMTHLGQFYLMAMAARHPAIESDVRLFAQFVLKWETAVRQAVLEAFELPEQIIDAVNVDLATPITWPPRSLGDVLFLAIQAAETPNPFADILGLGRRPELLDASLGNDGRAEFDALLAAARETRQQMLAVVTSA
ncbi:HDOD domain-containing protein [Thauera humireducens]|jgi:HD-like signal output (HDOD) protein|uniref:HDOD domain-containing protein n=1 Tax=Thauera TaxID=33057 RepID=UPI0002D01021|nr:MULTISPECIES: HDOD domain-containing protein [Thauera]ENO80438.1 hypothetical protein C664_01810 [Thauera sp. 63]CAH1748545.1 HDOD domain-containing protein [Thauera humireducens]